MIERLRGILNKTQRDMQELEEKFKALMEELATKQAEGQELQMQGQKLAHRVEVISELIEEAREADDDDETRAEADGEGSGEVDVSQGDETS